MIVWDLTVVPSLVATVVNTITVDVEVVVTKVSVWFSITVCLTSCTFECSDYDCVEIPQMVQAVSVILAGFSMKIRAAA